MFADRDAWPEERDAWPEEPWGAFLTPGARALRATSRGRLRARNGRKGHKRRGGGRSAERPREHCLPPSVVLANLKTGGRRALASSPCCVHADTERAAGLSRPCSPALSPMGAAHERASRPDRPRAAWGGARRLASHEARPRPPAACRSRAGHGSLRRAHPRPEPARSDRRGKGRLLLSSDAIPFPLRPLVPGRGGEAGFLRERRTACDGGVLFVADARRARSSPARRRRSDRRRNRRQGDRDPDQQLCRRRSASGRFRRQPRPRGGGRRPRL